MKHNLTDNRTEITVNFSNRSKIARRRTGHRRPAAAALCAMIFLGGCTSMQQRADQGATAAPDNAGAKAEVVELDNGFKVVLLEDHSAPVVSLQNWVSFGSADEEEEYAGVAHVFEHMLFKGTETYPQGEIGGLIEGAGGRVNAWTSYDETVYHLTVSSRYWETGFDVLSDAVVAPLLSAEELAKELEVVQEEIRRGKDNPDRQLWERLTGLTFKEHPYRRTVIGFPETVDKIDREALVRIFRQWYVPNNMYLVAVGDFDRERLLELVRAKYGSKPKQELPPTPRVDEPAHCAATAVAFAHEAELARLELAFPGVAADSPDMAALDVLSDLLSSGYNSILYRELKRKQNLVHEVSAFNWTPRDPGLFIAGAVLPVTRVEAVSRILMRELRATWDLAVGDDELANAKARILSGFVHNQETYQGVARMLGRFTAAFGDPNAAADYIRAVEAVTIDDLHRVARTYLRPEKVHAGVLVPEGNEPPAEAEVLEWIRSGAEDAGHSMDMRFERTSDCNVGVAKLPGGATLIVQTDRKAPLVSIAATVDGGVRAVPDGKEGVAELLVDTWTQGTELRSAAEIERELDRTGGSLGASASRDHMSLSGRFLKEHYVDGFEMFFDVLFRPSFPDKEVDVARADLVQEIGAMKEQRFRYALKYYLDAFYGDHPYGTLSVGTMETVEGLSPADLKAYHDRIVQPGGTVFAVVGDISLEEAVELFYRRLPAEFAVAGEPLDEVPAPAVPSEFREVVEPVDGAQTHIIWGFPTVNHHSEDRFALHVLDAVLSGMGGRLFLELRDEKSLAYAVTSFDIYPKETGFLAMYIGCSPDKEGESIGEFERVIREVKADGVTDEELQRAKRYLLGTQDIGLQATRSRAGSFSKAQLHHGRWDQYKAYAEGISAVTAADVQAVAERYLHPDRSVRVVLRAKDAAGGE